MGRKEKEKTGGSKGKNGLKLTKIKDAFITVKNFAFNFRKKSSTWIHKRQQRKL